VETPEQEPDSSPLEDKNNFWSIQAARLSSQSRTIRRGTVVMIMALLKSSPDKQVERRVQTMILTYLVHLPLSRAIWQL
jgi:hypothetical protein